MAVFIYEGTNEKNNFCRKNTNKIEKASMNPHRFKEGKIFPDLKASDGNVSTILFSSKTVLLCHVWERRSNFMRPVPDEHLLIDWSSKGGLWCSSSSLDFLLPMTGR